MSDKRFDDILRNRLSELRSSRTPDWVQFEKLMNEAQQRGMDESFDQLISDQLTKFQAKSDPRWPLLHSRIVYITNLVKNIHSVKLTEAVCMLLLLMFFHVTSWNIKDTIYLAGSGDESFELEYNADQMLNEEQTSKIKPLLSDNADENTTAEDLTRLDLNSGRRKVKANPQGIFNNIGSSATLGQNVIGPIAVNTTSLSQKAVIDGITTSGYLKSEVLKSQFGNQTVANLVELETKQSYLSYNRLEPLSNEIYFLVPKQSLEQFTINSLQFYSSFDNNLIYTPDDLAYNTNARTTEMHGLSLGVLYSKKFAAFEYESGLIYSSFNKPWNFKLQYGNSFGWYSFVMTNIHYDIVSVPLNVKYHFVENSDWSLFIQSGITNEIIAQSSFDNVTNYLGGGSVPIGSEPESPDDMQSPFEEDRNFNTGLFQGGKLSDNYFMRAGLGAGLQRNINEDLSLYFSGMYHRSIVNTSLGPNSDRLDKLSFIFGLKIRI